MQHYFAQDDVVVVFIFSKTFFFEEAWAVLSASTRQIFLLDLQHDHSHYNMLHFVHSLHVLFFFFWMIMFINDNWKEKEKKKQYILFWCPRSSPHTPHSMFPPPSFRLFSLKSCWCVCSKRVGQKRTRTRKNETKQTTPRKTI